MKRRNLFKYLGIVLLLVVLLPLLLLVALYWPPVQRWAVDVATAQLSEELGGRVHVGQVRLSPLFDLELGDMLAIDAQGDTLIDARTLVLDVAFWPLFSGRADVEAFEVHGARVNTKSLLPDVRVRGRVGQMTASAHGADWNEELLSLNHVHLADADLEVALSDTAQKDTTSQGAQWDIRLDKATLHNTALRLSLPGDTMHVAVRLGKGLLSEGRFDLGRKFYAFQHLSLEHSAASFNQSPRPLPHEALFDLRDARLVVETLNYDSLGHLRCRVAHVSLNEQLHRVQLSGLSGQVDMDQRGLRLRDWHLRTPFSTMRADLTTDWKALEAGKGGRLEAQLSGQVAPSELLRMAQAHLSTAEYRQLQHYAMGVLPAAPVGFQLGLIGNVGNLALRSASLSLPGVMDIGVRGYVKQALLPQRSGQLSLDLKAHNLARLTQWIPVAQRSTLQLPRTLSARAALEFAGDDYRTRFTVHQGLGQLQAQAHINLRTERYEMTTRLQRFPISQFLKGYPLTPFTGTLGASGQGFSPTALRTHLVAKADIAQLFYDRYPLGGLSLQARLRGGDAIVDVTARNPLVAGQGRIVAHLQQGYAASLDFDLNHLDMRRLTQGEDTLTFGAKFRAELRADKSLRRLQASGNVSRIRFITPLRGLIARDIDFALRSAPDSTSASIEAGDLDFRLLAAGHWTSLAKKATQLSTLVSKQLAQRHIDQEQLKRLLPEATLHLRAGTDNPIASLLHYHKYELGSLALDLSAHPREGLKGTAQAGQFKANQLLIDTMFSTLTHEADGLRLLATMRNERGHNPNPFTATLRSSLLHNGLSTELAFADKEGDLGLSIGARALLEEGGVSLSFFPDQPIVAYRRFDINADNYFFLGDDRSIRAHIDLLADDGTGIQVYSQPTDSMKNDITLSLKQLNLGELSNVLPYLPRLGGKLNGDFHLIDNHRQISAMGTVEATDFSYEGVPMGRLGAELVYLPKSSTEHQASAFIMADGVEVGECSGSYFNEGEGRFEGMATLRAMPLALLNGFFDGTQMALRGTADGEFTVKGTASAPVLNGSLDLNDAHLYSKTYGVDFLLDERPVVLDNSRLTFEDYSLRSTGDNALTLNGHIDMSRPGAMTMDFALHADNFALINTPRLTESAVYGKLYGDFDATVRGTMERLSVRGNLSVLPQTDVTYILTNSPLTVEDDLAKLVTFVNFADTLQLTQSAPPSSMELDVSMGIRLQPGARYHCFLSHNGESYVDVSGSGNLALRMTPLGEMRLTGRLNIDEGRMNYALPVIPLRTFTFEEGSYVEFTGPVMNPKLNISARDRIKTIVTENDRQRAVVFNAGVDITRHLEDMGLDFVIEAPEDLGVQNQLTTMSAEQRGKAAVALLATGMYVTDDNLSAGGLKASSALNAFLQKEIQSVAGRALSTIDLSFGLENGTSSAGTTTVDYAFQFSKRFLNDRMRVVIGGKVSTGADVQGSAQSFIDNIAIEYRLNQGGSRYVRVFYDREAHDPLEGTLMKTGAGLVLRRKSNSLGDLFLFWRKKGEDAD